MLVAVHGFSPGRSFSIRDRDDLAAATFVVRSSRRGLWEACVSFACFWSCRLAGKGACSVVIGCSEKVGQRVKMISKPLGTRPSFQRPESPNKVRTICRHVVLRRAATPCVKATRNSSIVHHHPVAYFSRIGCVVCDHWHHTSTTVLPPPPLSYVEDSRAGETRPTYFARLDHTSDASARREIE